MTAKLVSKASRLSSKGNVDAAAASRLQGVLAGDDDNPLFLGGIRVPHVEAITDAMGTAIATGPAPMPVTHYHVASCMLASAVRFCKAFMHGACINHNGYFSAVIRLIRTFFSQHTCSWQSLIHLRPHWLLLPQAVHIAQCDCMYCLQHSHPSAQSPLLYETAAQQPAEL